MSTNNVTATTARHIGRMNILAISGGRIVNVDANTINLPVHYGYSVEIEYMPGSDTYTVRRLWKRGATVKVRGAVEYVYADQVGDVAYRASCFRDDFGTAA